jgi:LysM repeat protein
MAYTVKKGDSLSKIAAALGLSGWRELYELNKSVIGGNPDLIKPGQVLQVPGESSSSGGGGTTTKPKNDGTTAAPKEETKDKTGIGTGELKILSGKDVKWHFDRTTGKWYVQYGLPNSKRSLLFEATPAQMDAIWGEGRRPTGYSNTTLKNLTTAVTGVTFAGSVAEMEGTGSFEAHVERVMTLALDEGRLPNWAKKSGEAMDIIFIAQAEGKNDDWVLDQLSKTKDFKKRFPKVQQFMSKNNLSLAEGIQGFLEFEAGVKQTLQGMGYENTIKNVSPDMVGNLLDKGYNIKTIQDTVAGFKRMREFKPALTAFNQVLKAHGIKPITKLNDQLKFLQGKAPVQMYDLWEQSSIQEAAVGAGLGHIFSVKDAIDLSRKGDFTLESATQGMQKAAELLLRMRHEVDTGKFGLDHEELIDISLGATPRSGRSQSEIFDNINRAISSAQKSLQQRGLQGSQRDQSGRPVAAGLQSLRRQS